MHVGAFAFRDAGLAWRSTRVDGVSWLPLWQADEASAVRGEARAAAVLIRMAPGAGYAPHRHVGTEDVLVLQGGYEDRFGIHRAGDHVHYAAGSEHAPRALAEVPREGGAPLACVLYAVVPGGIEVLAP